jgi:hypothetical protein
MSDTPDNPASPGSWFRPGFFLGGLLAGLVLLATAGHWAGRNNTHPGVARFHPRISPEGRYNPTVDELCAIVRARCRPDQILVIVGGNSIFNGVGQPPEKLWTDELQRQLGDRFAVVNLALRGAGSMEGGTVIAEVLREEFPRNIYVTNTSPFTPPAPLGVVAYQYIFWEAHFRGLLLDYAPRNKMLADYLAQVEPSHPPLLNSLPRDLRERIELTHRTGAAWMQRNQLRGEVWLDATLKYRDLWNWIGYEHMFTVPSFYTPRWPGWMVARGRLRDDEPDFEAMDFSSSERFSPNKAAIELPIVRGFSERAYTAGGPEGWTLNAAVRNDFLTGARGTMPDALKARTLVMLSRNSPYFVNMLSPAERQRDDLAYRDGAAAWRDAGYAAGEYGRDFLNEDFGDRTHLTAAGGRKLAAITAREVTTLAQKLGYLGEASK